MFVLCYAKDYHIVGKRKTKCVLINKLSLFGML